MKIINYLILSVLFICFACSNENPIEKEQYFKQIYLVGAYEYVLKPEIHYSEVPQETFVSVACSGSLNADEDVTVKLEVDPQVCEDYNSHFLGEGKEDQFYRVLKPSFYEIPVPQATILSGDVYARMGIKIYTENLHCDSIYAIPLRIDTATVYPINENIRTLLLSFKLVNDFSGSYEMTGTSNGQTISKQKTLLACGVHEVRMFYGMTREDDKALIPNSCIVLHINDNNKVTVSGWDQLQASGSGTYDPATKSFAISYDVTVNGETIHLEEHLRK